MTEKMRAFPKVSKSQLLFVLVIYCILYTGRELYAGRELLTRIGRGTVYRRPPEWRRNATELKSARDNAVQGLIRALQAATELAADGEEESAWFTPEARERWNRENPCLSKTEMRPKYRERDSVPYTEPHPRWREVLEEYSKLHRTCMHKVNGEPTAYFLSRNATGVNCKFTVVDTEDAAGLGNRLVMIASAFVYSLVTQRVLLIAREILPPQVPPNQSLNFQDEKLANPSCINRFGPCTRKL